MITQQTASFKRQKKKLVKKQMQALDEAVSAIANKPQLGMAKRGDLSEVLVYKYRVDSQEYLLAYLHPIPNKIILLARAY